MRMNLNKTIVCLLIICADIKAEIWPTLSIVDLAINSDRIVEAKHLETVGGESKFLVRELNNLNSNQDTIILKNLDRYFYNLENFEKAEDIILYLTKGSNSEISWSGIRVLINNRIHFPVQNMNPGKFVFGQSKDSLSWTQLKKNILESQQRINHVKEIKKLNDSKKLLKWIEEHSEQLTIKGGLNENKGWGTYSWEVFKWVTKNNESASTWKAPRLFKKIHFENEKEWLGFTGLLNDENGTSFKTYEEIDFLIETSLDESNKMIDRRQALVYLKSASRKVYENNYPIPEPHILNNQKKKQRSIRNKVLPLLENDGLKRFAFEVVSVMSNPMDGILEHRIDLSALQIIIDYYKNEEAGEFKSEIAYFIVHNSTNEQWKQISGCDQKIYIDIYSLRIDLINNYLSFWIRKRYGKEHFSDKPLVEIRDIKTDRVMHSEIFMGSKLSKYYGGGQKIIIDELDLSEGDYELQLRGKAGDKSQYSWQTLPVPFTVEKENHDNNR